MKPTSTSSEIVGRRAELMAELFFEELKPLFLSKPVPDIGYDLLAGFQNDKGGVNTFVIEVKSTEKPPGDTFSIPMKVFNRLAHSNVPALLLVADVKQNELYVGWLRAVSTTGRQLVSIPLIRITDSTRRTLATKLRKAELPVAAAG